MKREVGVSDMWGRLEERFESGGRGGDFIWVCFFEVFMGWIFGLGVLERVG